MNTFMRFNKCLKLKYKLAILNYFWSRIFDSIQTYKTFDSTIKTPSDIDRLDYKLMQAFRRLVR